MLFTVSDLLAWAVISGLALVWAAPPLFYELGAETTYPIPEGIVGGFMMAMNNAVACTIYLQLYIFPDFGELFHYPHKITIRCTLRDSEFPGGLNRGPSHSLFFQRFH